MNIKELKFCYNLKKYLQKPYIDIDLLSSDGKELYRITNENDEQLKLIKQNASTMSLDAYASALVGRKLDIFNNILDDSQYLKYPITEEIKNFLLNKEVK